MRLLHIIPRFIGGGPERHLLALAAAWRAAGVDVQQRVVILTPPASARLVIKARRLGIEILVAPDLPVIRDAIATADVVEIVFWNHPVLYDLLREVLPPSRWVLRSAVAGTTPPQVLTGGIGQRPDAVIVSSDRSLATPAVVAAQERDALVDSIPSLADMDRLAGFAPVAHQGIRVGYLGLIEPTKMHPRFAQMAADVTAPEVEFDLFGDGSWTEQLRGQFAAAGMSGRVRFHGHVEDIRRAFSEMDIFGYPLTPHTYATSEKVIQEAMWAGVPPVVLADSAAASLVDHERTGLVCRTEAEYGLAIDRLATDTAFRHRLGEAARDFAREHFDPARNAARFLGIYEALLARPTRAMLPLPGRDATGAQHFVQGLGHLGADFATSLGGPDRHARADLAFAEAAIARAPAVLANGEGGIVHYRHTYPDDPHLHFWSGLVLRSTGHDELARAEFEAAIRLGMDPARMPPAVAEATDTSSVGDGC